MSTPENSVSHTENNTIEISRGPIKLTQTLELSGQSDREIIVVKQKQKVTQVNRVERIINSVGGLIPSFFRR